MRRRLHLAARALSYVQGNIPQHRRRVTHPAHDLYHRSSRVEHPLLLIRKRQVAALLVRTVAGLGG